MTLKFGTSGLRGLVSELMGPPARTYTIAFARMLMARGVLSAGDQILVGRDLRSSSPEIAGIVHAAIAEAGLVPVDCGALPTPALALYATGKNAPAIMVTGSHIPDDRNGLKFYRADGEIDKRDELEIVAIHAGLQIADRSQPSVEPLQPGSEPSAGYRDHFLGFFQPHRQVGITLFLKLLRCGAAVNLKHNAIDLVRNRHGGSDTARRVGIERPERNLWKLRA